MQVYSGFIKLLLRVHIKKLKLTILIAISSLSSYTAQTQDLEPRFLSSMPTGTNVVVASYAFSRGNILLDNALPIENLESELNSMVVAYARSFKLFNKLAKVDAVVPYAFSNFSGLYESRDSTTSRKGFGDPSFRISMILIGEDPLSAGEFRNRTKKRFNLGVMTRVRIPLGQYDTTKLINLGTNRYSLKLGVAGSYALTKKITWEVHFNTWHFTKNNSFFNGNTIKQKPLITLQTHFSYEFKPGFWAAVSFGKSNLGETVLNGIEKNDDQKNTRTGFAIAYRLNKKHTLKIAATTGVTTRYGSDYTTVLLAYQYLWFNKSKK